MNEARAVGYTPLSFFSMSIIKRQIKISSSSAVVFNFSDYACDDMSIV